MATIDWSVRAVRDEDDLVGVRQLFRDYAGWLGESACLKNFDEEVDGLPGEYGPPKGILLIGHLHGKAVGCAGVRRLAEPIVYGRQKLRGCELKRLYVAPEARGEGVGRGLVRRALREAHALRYQAMVLDTIPGKMEGAIKLYEEFGFEPCAPYNDGPKEGVLYMIRRLT